MSATAFGSIAAVIILASFALRGEKKIRAINLVGNVFLILYAIKLEPVNYILLLLGVSTIVVHCIHFLGMLKEAKAAKALAKAESRAAEAEAKLDTQLGIASKERAENGEL